MVKLLNSNLPDKYFVKSIIKLSRNLFTKEELMTQIVNYLKSNCNYLPKLIRHLFFFFFTEYFEKFKWQPIMSCMLCGHNAGDDYQTHEMSTLGEEVLKEIVISLAG